MNFYSTLPPILFLNNSRTYSLCYKNHTHAQNLLKPPTDEQIIIILFPEQPIFYVDLNRKSTLKISRSRNRTTIIGSTVGRLIPQAIPLGSTILTAVSVRVKGPTPASLYAHTLNSYCLSSMRFVMLIWVAWHRVKLTFCQVCVPYSRFSIQ